MKEFLKKSIILFVISAISTTILLLPGRSSARNIFKEVSIYQKWNWNYGEPGHDPDWVIRGRGRDNGNNGNGGEGNNGNGRGNSGDNNGNGVGASFPGPGGEDPDPGVNICIGILTILENIIPGK